MTTSSKITSEQTEGPQTFKFTKWGPFYQNNGNALLLIIPSAHYNSPISKTVRSPGSTMTRVFCEYFRSGSFEPFSSATKLPWNVESWFVWPHNSDGSRKRRKLHFLLPQVQVGYPHQPRNARLDPYIKMFSNVLFSCIVRFSISQELLISLQIHLPIVSEVGDEEGLRVNYDHPGDDDDKKICRWWWWW